MCKDNHWFMYVLDKRHNCLYEINSMNKKYSFNEGHLITILDFFIKAGFVAKKMRDSFNWRRLATQPQQHNNDDCGLAVCMNARALHRKNSEQYHQPGFDWGY